jgi:hypothetical protein
MYVKKKRRFVKARKISQPKQIQLRCGAKGQRFWVNLCAPYSTPIYGGATETTTTTKIKKKVDRMEGI